MSNMGTHQTAKTHCPRGHPYDDANTRFYTYPKTGLTQRLCRACGKGRSTRHSLKRYGITEEERARLFEEQQGICAIAGCDKEARDTDHDHRLGKVRGLLCNPHNMAIGLFGDSPSSLRAAADYLEIYA